MGLFRVRKTVIFRTRLSAKPFLVKMSYICMRIKEHFHINGFGLSLALKQRLGATQKWPIARTITSTESRPHSPLLLVAPSGHLVY